MGGSGRRAPAAARTAAALLTVLPALTVAACSGSAGAGRTSRVDPVVAQLQQRLDALPAVDGATRTAASATPGRATETFAVPAGTPACLQLLSRLDAAGYGVVTAAGVAVVPTTCTTADGTDPSVGERAGTATVLAAGGSQVALTWTATTYRLTATP